MNYFDRNAEQVLVTSALLTKAVILGESKKGIGAMISLLKPGHTIKFKKNDETIKSSEIYSKTGLVKIENDIYEYYEKKDDDIEKLGCRLALEWELKNWDEELKEKYELCDTPPRQKFNNIIKAENRERVVSAILQGWHDKDQLKIVKRTNEVLQETNQNLKGMDEQLTGVLVDVKTLLNKNRDKGSVFFNVRDPIEPCARRREELKELHDLLQQSSENVTVISRITSICGLGGVGKTQLVRLYIQEYCQNYDNNIMWMNAENYETLTESFLKLAGDERVCISTKDMNGIRKDVRTLVDEVYRYFAIEKSLFVFDNADKYSMQQDIGIVTFLPASLMHYAHKPHFVFTSRNQKWPEGTQILQLNVLSPEDAIDFINRALKKNENNVETIELAETLQYFPLALQQAVAYIRVTNEKLKILGGTFDINDYLKRYGEETKELLGFEFPEDSSDIYLHTTSTTWNITTDKMRDNFGNSLALNILDIIAYIAPDNIPVEMFLDLECINHDREKLGDALQPLLQYSMVDLVEQQSSLNVHRLVQQVTRLTLSHKMEIEEVIKTTFQLLENCYPYTSDKVEDIAMKRKLLSHSEVFLTHLDEWSAKKPEYEHHIEKQYIIDILASLCHGYRVVGNYEREKVLLVRELAIKQKYFGPEDLEVAGTLTNLGNTHGSLGDPERKKELLERALAIHERHYGPDHFEVARTQVNLGSAHVSLGNLEEGKQLLERSLVIMERHYGPNHYQIAATFTNLGNAYGSLGDLKKKKELLERALKIEEGHYGPDHFEVARTLVNLENAHVTLGNPEKGKEFLERGLEIMKKHYGPDHIEVAETLRKLGNAYDLLGDPEKKTELLKRVLEINERHHGPDDLEVAIPLENLASAYNSLGRLAKVEECLERGLAIMESQYGLDHLEVARILLKLGNACVSFGNPKKGKDIFKRALAIEERHYGPDHLEAAQILVNLGNAYVTLGNPEKGKGFLERALLTKERHYGPDDFEVVRTLVNLRAAHGTLGNPYKQKELLERAVTIEERHDGLEHRELISFTIESLGSVYGELRNYPKAYELYERSSRMTDMQTSLHLATRSGNLKTVEYILEKGADVLARNAHDAVLHSAVPNSHLDVLRLILDKIKDKYPHDFFEHVNAKDAEGDTPLMWAAQYGNVDAARILLEHGADPKIQSLDNMMALLWAERNGYRETAQLLLDHDAEHNIENKDEQILSTGVEGSSTQRDN